MKNGIFDLSGKVALVTGGGAGLGRAMCEGMAEFGADVVCVDWNAEKAKETVDLLRKLGRKTLAIKTDVSKQDEVESMVLEAEKSMGSIDIVFANAGIVEPNWVRIHEKNVAEWDQVMSINLRGIFLVMKAVFPVMLKKKKGSFITTSSVAALPPTTIPFSAAYTVAKAGVISLTKAAARQYAEYGIRVNSICPGFHRTSMQFGSEEKTREIEQYHLKSIPLGRTAAASEIKGLAVWLASDASSFVTGQIFVQDGGQSS